MPDYFYELVVVVDEKQDAQHEQDGDPEDAGRRSSSLITYYGPCLTHILRELQKEHNMKLSRSHVHRSVARKTKQTRGTKACVLAQKVLQSDFKASTVCVRYVS